MTMNQTEDSSTESAGTTITAFGVSYAITSFLSALLVVWKESSQAVHDTLAAITGHHWVTHGALDVIVFVGLGLLLSRTRMAAMSGRWLITTVVGATVVSGLIIAGYFI